MYFNNQPILCDAIRNKRVIKFRYDNEFTYREVQPYAVFESTVDKTLLYGIQLSDESKAFHKPESRNYDIKKINDILLTSTNFAPDINFSINNIKTCKREICVIQK